MKRKAAVIAVCNQKGGVAKTTTVENLGIGLAREGKRVLLVDNDPQASLTVSLGWPQPDRMPLTLPDLMTCVADGRTPSPIRRAKRSSLRLALLKTRSSQSFANISKKKPVVL